MLSNNSFPKITLFWLLSNQKKKEHGQVVLKESRLESISLFAYKVNNVVITRERTQLNK